MRNQHINDLERGLSALKAENERLRIAEAQTGKETATPVLKTVMSKDMKLLATFHDYDYFNKVMAALSAASTPRTDAAGRPAACSTKERAKGKK